MAAPRAAGGLALDESTTCFGGIYQLMQRLSKAPDREKRDGLLVPDRSGDARRAMHSRSYWDD